MENGGNDLSIRKQAIEPIEWSMVPERVASDQNTAGSIPCPPIVWPSTLATAGPAEDPAIMLAGTARVGPANFSIVAIRVEPRLRFMPDYRIDLEEDAYDRNRLEMLLQELAELSDSDDPPVLEFPTGFYVLYMIPRSDSAEPS